MKRRSLIIATLIGTMLDSYDNEDKTKLHRELQMRIRKGIERYKKKNGSAAALALVMIGDRVWKRAIDFFKEKDIYIEASNLVLRLWIEDEKNLAKDYGLGKGKVGVTRGHVSPRLFCLYGSQYLHGHRNGPRRRLAASDV